MFVFDKNGNEIKVDDLVYFSTDASQYDDNLLNKIGKIMWFRDTTDEGGFIKISKIYKPGLYNRNPDQVRLLPKDVWALVLLEREYYSYK